MRYVHLIENIKSCADNSTFIKEKNDGDIYENLNSGEHRYPHFNITVNNASKALNTWTYNLTLFYTDRLTEDYSNKNSITDLGIVELQKILNQMKETFDDFDYSNVQFIPFTQKFNDLCGGVYCTVTVVTFDQVGDCAWSYDSPFMLQEKDVEITNNGEQTVIPDNGYYGLKRVNITTAVPNGIPVDSFYYNSQVLEKEYILTESDGSIYLHTMTLSKDNNYDNAYKLKYIKWIRSLTHCGLKAAKDYVEYIIAGNEITIVDYFNKFNYWSDNCGFFTSKTYANALSDKPVNAKYTLVRVPFKYEGSKKQIVVI